MAAYILTTEDGTGYWAGSGVLPLYPRMEPPPRRLPLWQDRQSAVVCAQGIRDALGIILHPCLVRVRGK